MEGPRLSKVFKGWWQCVLLVACGLEGYSARPHSTNECVTNTKSRYSAKISFLKSSAVLYSGSFLLSVNTAQDDVYINRRPKLNWLLACFLCECVCVGRGKNFSEKKSLFLNPWSSIVLCVYWVCVKGARAEFTHGHSTLLCSWSHERPV